jgi:hypothetical protein
MNVYSLQVIPKLKLKFCEALGIASAFAIQELSERLIRLDQKMDRFESQLRKIHRHQMVLESTQVRHQAFSEEASGPIRMEKDEKKKRRSVKSSSPIAKRRLKKTNPIKRLPKEKPGDSKESLDNVTPIPVRTAAPDGLPLVLMIQSDGKTQAVIREYFGKSAKVLNVGSVEEIPEGVEKDKLVAIFFERNLLSNEQAQVILQELQSSLPKTRFVGVSNYLTLALAKAADVEEDFATFLTQPITEEDLAAIFSEGQDAPNHDPDEPRENFIAGRD